MTNKKDGVLYIGVTNDVYRRAQEHKIGSLTGFTKKYGLGKLVWYTGYESIEDAIIKEKQLKKWKREWKIDLIEQMNPTWEDLSSKIVL